MTPETAPQLDRGNPVLRRYDQVDGREPQRQRQLGGVEDRARRGGCLLLAPVALVEAPARQHTMPAMAAGGADEAVRPAQPGQCRAALLLGAEGFAKRLVAQPAHPRCNLEPHIRNLPRQERTKNICLPKRSVTDKQAPLFFAADANFSMARVSLSTFPLKLGQIHVRFLAEARANAARQIEDVFKRGEFLGRDVFRIGVAPSTATRQILRAITFSWLGWVARVRREALRCCPPAILARDFPGGRRASRSANCRRTCPSGRL